MDSIWIAIQTVEINPRNLPAERMNLRTNQNPITALSDAHFKKNFRITKEAFKYILNILETELKPTVKFGLTCSLKLAAVLRFLAEGSYQNNIGNDFHIAIAQSTFSKVLTEVLDILEKNLCPKFINLKMSDEEKMNAKLDFFEKCRIPNITMCIDGTHVKIVKPKENPHLYLNRKGYYSINTMIICDSQLKIRYVDGTYQGSNHDSHIWNISESKKFIESQYKKGDQSQILGDAGYALEPWLLTPYRSAHSDPKKAIFNKQHAKGRNVIERVNGVLKNRFRCLLDNRTLHYEPTKASQIINVCCALHNLCIDFNITYDDEQIMELDEDINLNDCADEINSSYSAEAAKIRDNIMQIL